MVLKTLANTPLKGISQIKENEMIRVHVKEEACINGLAKKGNGRGSCYEGFISYQEGSKRMDQGLQCYQA